jgi:hypothetical protein
MTDLMIPRVHLNGTSEAELLQQIHEARHALRNALTVMARGTPHDRDYYVIGDDAGPQAREQHYARVAKVESVLEELEQIAQGILFQNAR